jgi:hypothetical protein
MIQNLHLVQFYESRATVQHRNSDPCKSPHTELTSVPESATIRYRDQENQAMSPDTITDSFERNYEASRFFIERAMLDPDAVVVPT